MRMYQIETAEKDEASRRFAAVGAQAVGDLPTATAPMSLSPAGVEC
jgi:hypothetical protein